MSSEALFVTIVPAVALTILLATTAGNAPWGPERILGLVFIVGGLAILTMARLNLGSSFSVTPQARKLVTNGIYSRVQHPVYVFSGFIFAGLPLYFGKPIFLLALAALVPIQIVRARQEAKVLEDKFGDDYLAWKRTTWF